MPHGFTPFSLPSFDFFPFSTHCPSRLLLFALFSTHPQNRPQKLYAHGDLGAPEPRDGNKDALFPHPEASPSKTFSWASLGSHAGPLNHRLDTGPWGTKTGQLGDVPTPSAGSGGQIGMGSPIRTSDRRRAARRTERWWAGCPRGGS